MSEINVYTDGGYSPVHSRGMICYIINGGQPQHSEFCEHEVGNLTSNTMEFIAILSALEDEKVPSGSLVNIHSDSQLAVKQLSKEWNINYNHLHELALKIWKAGHDKHLKLRFKWVSRDDNPAGHFIEQNGHHLIGKKYKPNHRPTMEDDW